MLKYILTALPEFHFTHKTQSGHKNRVLRLTEEEVVIKEDKEMLKNNIKKLIFLYVKPINFQKV